MVENIFYTDAKELVVKLVCKEFPSMPEKFVTYVMNFLYKFCNYEEEGHKIRPSVLITNNIDTVIKNIPTSYKLPLFFDQDESQFNSRMKALMGFSQELKYITRQLNGEFKIIVIFMILMK